MKHVVTFLILFWILSSESGSDKIYAQQIRFEQLSLESGLSQSTIMCLFQDRRGYIWVGTQDGLNRYDGYQFTVFKSDVNDTASLSNNIIWSIFEDHQGDMWIGTEGGGLNRYNRKKGNFTRFRHNPHDHRSLASDYVRSVFCDTKGNLWIGTDAGLHCYDPDSSNFRRFQFSVDDTTSLSQNFVRTIIEDEGGLWIGTRNAGICYLPDRSTRFRRYRFASVADAVNHTRALYRDKSGSLWVGTLGGAFLYHKTIGQWQHFKYEKNDTASLGGNAIRGFVEDDQGNIWMTTDGGGVSIFHPDKKQFVRIRSNENAVNGLKGNVFLSVMKDRNGILWIGSQSGGLFRYDYKQEKLHHVSTELSNKDVYSILEDQDGTLWIGSIQGLHQRKPTENIFRTYYLDKTNINDAENYIWSLCAASRKTDERYLWIGTNGGGLFRMDKTNGRIKRYSFQPKANSISNNFITRVIEDREGYLWIGTNGGGLNRFDPATEQFIVYENDPKNEASLSNNRIFALYEDQAGVLWVGTSNGLNRMDRGTGMFKRYRNDPKSVHSLSHNYIGSILEDRHGRLWVGTFGGGLNLMDRNTERFSVLREYDGLPNDVIYGIMEDSLNYLWLSTNKGIARYNPDTKVIKTYGPKDGAQSLEFNMGAYFYGPSGRMYFGGINGFNVFDPITVIESSNRPPVVLTDFRIFNESQKPPVALDEVQTLQLSYWQNVFSFEFAALNYTITERNQYAYMMEGFDKTWLYSGTRRYVSYTNLHPGEYIFRVKASNHDGVWNEDGASVMIVITPPFWQTWWFRLLMLGFVGLVAWGTVRLRSYYAEYRKTHYVSHYKLLEKIGEGGMGVVYKARDRVSGKTVALKLLHESIADTKDGLQRFLKEAEVGKLIHHPNVVKIYGAGSSETRRFITMEMVEGKTLKQLIREKGALPVDETLRMALHIAEGLKEIHRHGVVHRDLKSENVLLRSAGSLVIMDFGLARIKGMTSAAARDQLVGTLAYMSPEQSLGKEVDHRSDIYSFGVIMYEMLYGEMPFIANNEMELILAIHNETPPRLVAAVQTPYSELIRICLAKSPEQRFGDVQMLMNNLGTLRVK